MKAHRSMQTFIEMTAEKLKIVGIKKEETSGVLGGRGTHPNVKTFLSRITEIFTPGKLILFVKVAAISSFVVIVGIISINLLVELRRSCQKVREPPRDVNETAV